MKNILKKNQVIIAALAIMIVVAGYLNFTKGKVGDIDASKNPDVQTEGHVEGDKDDQSAAIPDDQLEVNDNNELASVDGEKETGKSDEDQNDVGSAVLANNNNITANYFIDNKLQREQTRAQNEATLKEIASNKDLSAKQKQDAIDKLVALTDTKEKELAAESLLQAKGFSDVLVMITDGKVDVVVNANNLTEQQMAQIQDIVKRKTGISAKNIVIAPAPVTKESEEKKEDGTEESKDTTNEKTDDTKKEADEKE